MLAGQIDLGAHESVTPEGIHKPPVAEELDVAPSARAPDEHDSFRGEDRRTKAPRPRSGPAGRRRLNPGSQALAAHRDVAGGVAPQGRQRPEEEAPPDLGGVQAVEVLDGILETELPRGDKDGGNIELQAEPYHPTEDISMLMRSLEARVVIELSVGRAPHRLPMRDETGHDPARGRGAKGPGGGQPAVERDAREDVSERSAGELEVLQDVEEVQFGLLAGHSGQVPSWRRRRTPEPLATNEPAVPRQDAANRADTRRVGDAVGLQRAVDRRRAVLAEHTVGTQFVTQEENVMLEGQRRAIDRGAAPRRATAPVDPIQALPTRAGNPHLDGAQADAKSPSGRPHRRPAPHRSHHGATPLLKRGFLFTGSLLITRSKTPTSDYRMLSVN